MSVKTNGRKIVSIEGIDRSGKSTLMRKVLAKYGNEVEYRKFPNKEGAYGKMVYECLETDLDRYKDNYCLYNSFDKNQGVEDLGEGLCIIDRFDVTQYVYGRGLGVPNPLEYLNYKSDYVIYLDISVEESLRRGKELGDSDLLEKDGNILYNVKRYYDEYLTELEESGREVYYIDGTLSEEEIYNKVVTILDKVRGCDICEI